ncbi:discoidin domain-containing receptor 2-like isoform X2 [Penaeus japonicus]|uniref:discoidin domain-containing receptor 2-like isoform X2 n=1 Tax=Penaeus japonicus TaxID=27405 RepID=UPI001C70BD37|nr:discoidin domain-containing receptor 2-like isoform X2 [Penaeus japonicus]
MAEGAGGGPVPLLPGRCARLTRPTTPSPSPSSTTTPATTCSRAGASQGRKSSPLKTFADRDTLQPRGLCANAAPGGNGAVSCPGRGALEGAALPPTGRHAHCVPRRVPLPPTGPPMPRGLPSSTCTPEGTKVGEGGERGPLRSAPGGVRGVPRPGGRWSWRSGAPAALLASTFLLTLLAPARGFNLATCNGALGMESGKIQDSQISASSSYDVSVTGPSSARLNVERAGGAWCPREMVGQEDLKEYLEIDLEAPHVISVTESQGRFGNGQGVEFVEQYMLEYWRHNTWYTYKKWNGDKILQGNKNQYMPVRNELVPPIIASKIRFVPFSPHPRTVCMRVELHGCPYEDGLVSYSMAQGQDRGMEVDLLDLSYDGTTTEGLLYGGLGQLHDGITGDHNFRTDIGHGKGYEWVGWKNDTQNPLEIICEFDVVRNFTAMHIYANNMYTKDVQVFSRARVLFSVGGRYFGSRPIEYNYMTDEVSEYGRNVSIKLHHRVGKYVKIQLFFKARWIMVSEIFFVSRPARGNFSELTETEELPPEAGGAPHHDSSSGYMHDGAALGDKNHRNLVVTDVSEEPRGQEYVALVIGVLIAVIILLVSAILLIVWRARRQKAGTITHDIFTGPYGEKRDIVNLKEVQKFLTAPAVLRPSSLCSSPRLATHRSNGYRLNTTLPIHPSQPECAVPGLVTLGFYDSSDSSAAMGVEGGDIDKAGLYSEPYHMTYNSIGGYSSMAHKMSHPNPLSSPDYTASDVSAECPSTEYAIPHMSGEAGATGGYPPPLPHSKPPLHTLNTFLGKPPPTPLPPNAAQPQESFYAATEIVAVSDVGSNGTAGGRQGQQGQQGAGAAAATLENVTAREIPRSAITLLQQIGEGQFGEVHLGEVEDEEGQKQMVAVKTLRLEASHSVRCDFEREVEILARLRDPNIVQVVGVCSREEPLCMLVEYMEHGDLNQYLQAHIAETASPRNTHAKTLRSGVGYGCLIYMATQIASGMKYLESLNFVHRDLATRNCLVGAGHVIKISDFGMSRNLYSADYYRIEGKALLPIRWMAWESVLLGKFTTKSDVWSFAVTLWEILTMAREQPYEDLTDEQVIENVSYIYHNEARKALLPQPANCPKEIYDLMRECWKRSDADRPTFREIHMFLQRKNLGYSPVT